MSVHLIYDLCAFSHSVQDGKVDVSTMGSFKEKICAYASFGFLEELSAIRKTNKILFNTITDRYITATYNRMIYPWNEVAQREVIKGSALNRDEVLLEKNDYLDVINLLNDKDIDNLSNEVRIRKQKYLSNMNEALINILNNPLLVKEKKREIRKGFSDWYNKAEDYIQSWAESTFKRTDLDYKKLPHVRLSLYYFFAKHYQTTVQGRKFRASELYDRGYFIEAYTLGTLVTDDNDLKSTAGIIPNHGIEVIDFPSFIKKYGNGT